MVRETEECVGKVETYCDMRKRRAVKEKVVGEKGFPPRRGQSAVWEREQESPACPSARRSASLKG